MNRAPSIWRVIKSVGSRGCRVTWGDLKELPGIPYGSDGCRASRNRWRQRNFEKIEIVLWGLGFLWAAPSAEQKTYE